MIAAGLGGRHPRGASQKAAWIRGHPPARGPRPRESPAEAAAGLTPAGPRGLCNGAATFSIPPPRQLPWLMCRTPRCPAGLAGAPAAAPCAHLSPREYRPPPGQSEPSHHHQSVPNQNTKHTECLFLERPVLTIFPVISMQV